MNEIKQRLSGYDKYIDWKLFIFPVIILAGMLLMPPTAGMRDVGTEYSLGHKAVNRLLTLNVRRLLVMDKGKAAGVVREQDLVFELDKVIRSVKTR